MKALSAADISFKYKGQEKPLFSGVSFNLDKGEIAAITGPSGCGKSTLGYCLSGVIPNLIEGTYTGLVTVFGRLGIVFQDPDAQVFFPFVEDELAFAPENLCVSRDEIKQRIESTLSDLGISHLINADPSTLSGGQKQLVALGGVLTLNPDVLILDESLSQLDKKSKIAIKGLLLSMKSKGVSIVLIEHEKQNYDIADQVWYLNNGDLQPIDASNGEGLECSHEE